MSKTVTSTAARVDDTLYRGRLLNVAKKMGFDRDQSTEILSIEAVDVSMRIHVPRGHGASIDDTGSLIALRNGAGAALVPPGDPVGTHRDISWSTSLYPDGKRHAIATMEVPSQGIKVNAIDGAGFSLLTKIGTPYTAENADDIIGMGEAEVKKLWDAAGAWLDNPTKKLEFPVVSEHIHPDGFKVRIRRKIGMTSEQAAHVLEKHLFGFDTDTGGINKISSFLTHMTPQAVLTIAFGIGINHSLNEQMPQAKTFDDWDIEKTGVKSLEDGGKPVGDGLVVEIAMRNHNVMGFKTISTCYPQHRMKGSKHSMHMHEMKVGSTRMLYLERRMDGNMVGRTLMKDTDYLDYITGNMGEDDYERRFRGKIRDDDHSSYRQWIAERRATLARINAA